MLPNVIVLSLYRAPSRVFNQFINKWHAAYNPKMSFWFVVKNIIYWDDDKKGETTEVFFNNLCLGTYCEFCNKNSK